MEIGDGPDLGWYRVVGVHQYGNEGLVVTVGFSDAFRDLGEGVREDMERWLESRRNGGGGIEDAGRRVEEFTGYTPEEIDDRRRELEERGGGDLCWGLLREEGVVKA